MYSWLWATIAAGFVGRTWSRNSLNVPSHRCPRCCLLKELSESMKSEEEDCGRIVLPSRAVAGECEAASYSAVVAAVASAAFDVNLNPSFATKCDRPLCRGHPKRYDAHNERMFTSSKSKMHSCRQTRSKTRANARASLK